MNVTGLSSEYDFTLKIALQDPVGDAEEDLPSLLTALKEQLGLELKPRMVTVDTLVIEHVSKTATAN